MITELHGVFTALATPFSPDGHRINEEGLRELVEANIKAGIHGLIPCGSTGEFASLSYEERKEITRITCEQAGKRVPVVPQTGSSNLIEVIELSKHSEACGAAGVMVVFPFYEPINMDEIFNYYKIISDAIHIPIMVYNSPYATKQNLSPAFLAKMAREIKNVRYVKDSSASLSQLTELVYRYNNDITVFNGWDTMFFPAFALGCKGSVTGPGSVIPKECADVYNLVKAGKLKEAEDLYKKIWPLFQFFEGTKYNAAIKAGANLVGFHVGDARPPHQPLSAPQVEDLRQLLIKAGVITA